MAKAVSTDRSGAAPQGTLAFGRPARGESIGSCSSALGALHAAFYPVVGIDAGRRIHALGGETHNVDDFGFVLLLVKAVGTVRCPRDALMLITDGEFDGT